MSKNLFFFLFFAVSLQLVLAQGASQQVKVLTLDNGMTVWLNEDHSQPKVFGAVVVKAGAIDCPNTGIAHYFEHILFKGTDELGTTNYRAEKPILDSIALLYDRLGKTKVDTERLAIQRNINRLSGQGMQYAIPNEFSSLTARLGGTELNAQTSYDYTYYHNVFSPQYINEWLELNSHRLMHPVFRLFQNELETVYEEKNMYSDNMVVVALENALKEVMKGTPYAYPILGSTESLKNPSLSEMQEFFNKYYVANNMGLILCGDFQAEDIIPMIRRTFGMLRRGETPKRPEVTLQQLNGQEGVLKLNIPIISATARVYKAPKNGTREALAMRLAVGLLNNASKSGLADSLMSDGKILGAIVTQQDLKYVGGIIVASVPNILSSKTKAENLLMAQIDKLKEGKFSESALSALKLEKQNAWKRSLETIGSRSDVLINAFANFDFTWQEYMNWQSQIGSITKEEVMAVCRKYFGEKNYYHFKKKMGSYPKDKLTQPGFKSLVSKNMDKRSLFAQHIDSLASGVTAKPRLVDFQKDVWRTEVSPLISVYTTKNPQDNLFNLSLTFRKGTKLEPKLEPVVNYVNELGTEKHSRQELNRALQQMGATLEISTTNASTTFSVTGMDEHFDETMQLLAEMMKSPKTDKKQFNALLSSLKMEERSMDKDNANIAQMLMRKIYAGKNSSYLCRATYKDIKGMTQQQLLDIYRDVQKVQCCVTYSGALEASQLATKVRNLLALEVTKERKPKVLPFVKYTEPVVYFVNKMGARQSIVGTYALLDQPQDDKGLATMDVWSRYFGGSMSSVLFQEVREMRSMAYNVSGSLSRYALKENYRDAAPYITYMSTQADKTLQAMAVMDSLWLNMPLRRENVEVAKSGIVASVNNNYPSFRGMPGFVATQEWNHYAQDNNTYKAQYVPEVTAEDVQTIWQTNVKDANRVWFVVGDKKKIDFHSLSKYGKVVEVKTAELFRK